MAVTKFTWNNGTEEHPVPLSSGLIRKLIRAAKSDLDIAVAGWYKDPNDAPVAHSSVYLLEQAYPDLHFSGETFEDTVSVVVDKDILLEGQSLTLTSTGTLDVADCKFVIEVTDVSGISVGDGLTEQMVRNRLAAMPDNIDSGGNMPMPLAQENASWRASFKIKAYPTYADPTDPTAPYTYVQRNDQDAVITVRGIKATGIRVSVPSELGINSSISIIPSLINSGGDEPTKAPGITNITASTSAGDVSVNLASNTVTYYAPSSVPVGTGIASVSVSVYLFGNSTAVGSVSSDIVIYETKATVIRLDQTIEDPLQMIVTGSNGKKNTGFNPATNQEEQPTGNVVSWIRHNTHRYAGKYDSASSTMRLRRLYDGDSNYYTISNDSLAQGQSAANDINNVGVTSDSDVVEVFLKFDQPFYYKTVNEVEDGQETGLVDIYFADGPLDEDYKAWDTNKLIGVYEGTVKRVNGDWVGDVTAYNTEHEVTLSGNPNSSYPVRLYSVSGQTPTNNFSQANFRAAANARANTNSSRFRLIDYEAHVAMALLYYGYWGGLSINCQEVCGYGTAAYPKVTGQTNTLGMSDTRASEQGNSQSINFWGLENWWGDLYEWMDNLRTANATGLVNIYGYNNLSGTWEVQRQVQVDTSTNPETEQPYFPLSTWRPVKRFRFGEHCDLIGAELRIDSDWTKSFCDGGIVYALAGTVARRSAYDANADGGVGCLYVSNNDSYVYAYIGSRLLYEGKIELVDEL